MNKPDKPMDDSDTRAAFVALIGAPNAGKSTLLNQLVGSKISIVTPKVQTTRMRVLGISMAGTAQLVFVDTPGIFAPRRRLDRAMVSAAWTGARDADLIVALIDAKSGITADVERMLEGLGEQKKPVFAALNKVDTVKRSGLLALAEKLNKTGLFEEIFMISALTGDGVPDLMKAVEVRAPEGPWLFPPDQLTDMNDRMLAAELTREKLFLKLYQELPYALTVETERWEQFRDGSIRIEQTIYVERDSQKPIILGKGGRQVKAVGEEARLELAELLGCKVHLFLFVKVREKWSEDPARYRELGLEFDA